MKDQPVLILGLGASGLSMARWCVRQGARVTVADTREAPPQREALQRDCPGATFVAGAFDATLLAREPWALIARSPGLMPEALQTVFEHARAQQIPVLTELDLFAQALQALSQRERFPYRPKVLAITGTNGKTTVTSLTGLLLQRAGWPVAVAGNIGPALLDVLGQALDAEAVAQAADDQRAAAEQAAKDAAEQARREAAQAAESPEPAEAPAQAELPVDTDAPDTEAPADDEPLPAPPEDEAEPLLVPPPAEPPPAPHLPRVWVLELSSFQLDGTAQGAWATVPTAATLLNLTEDHLDWHGSMDAYAQAKAAVFGSQALMVLNRDDPRVMALKPGLVTVKVGNRNRQVPARPWMGFGLDAPTRAGDWGLETVNGMTWLVRALALDETRAKGKAQADEEVYFQRLMPAEALRIRGRHNAANALAALALATSTGAPLAPMLHGLREYRGEPHRVEFVVIVGGVEFLDDSKGTNVGATVAAIAGLAADREGSRLSLLLGGDGKGQDFTPLLEPIRQHARAVALIGRDGPALLDLLAPLAQAGLPVALHADLPAATRWAFERAEPGDTVLLSPACASLDMFKNYAHRAEVFVATAREIAADRGEVL